MNIFNRIIFLIVITCTGPVVFGQYNPATNNFSPANNYLPATVQQQNGNDNSAMGGFPCSPNTFWAVSAGVDQYTLAGSTVMFNTTLCAPYIYSLAYCNNLNGGSFSPTFYDADDSLAAYYNGSGWTQIPLPGPGRLFNCGGNGNYLYYCVAPAAAYVNSIARYDGTSFTTIYTLADPNKYVSVADLNIDDNGNVWFFIGFPVSPFNTDSLYVVSPTGQLLKQYAFNYNTQNAYGSFMLNGIIYIGLGSANTFHPNTLVPVTVTATTATAGTPIPMPAGINYGDLASCNAGNPLAVKDLPDETDFHIYPNPATDEITISCREPGKFDYRILNVNGSSERLISGNGGTLKLDIRLLPAGVYFIETTYSKGILRKKFVKL